MCKKNPSIETVKNSITIFFSSNYPTISDLLPTAFWVYHIVSKTWQKIYHNENIGSQYWTTMQNKEPRPRFAHQLVFDSRSKVKEEGMSDLRNVGANALFLTPKDSLFIWGKSR